MESRDCSIPVPLPYRLCMYCCHLISYPVYIATLTVLFRDTSKPFRTYKYYMIVHIILNMVSELFVSIMMLPLTYLPHPLLRTTGLMARLGFSGLVQWNILVVCVMLTGGSICEMFYYRFKVSIFDYKQHRMNRVLWFSLYFFWGMLLLHVFFTTSTIETSLIREERERMRLWQATPGLAPEVTCYSVIIAVTDDWITQVNISIIVVSFFVCFLSGLSALCCIVFFLKSGHNLSRATVKLQIMFVLSLLSQGCVHVFMIAVPAGVIFYVIFHSLLIDFVARFMFGCVAYRGFFSTCAMILFTKPLRDKMFCIKPKQIVSAPISVQSIKL